MVARFMCCFNSCWFDICLGLVGCGLCLFVCILVWCAWHYSLGLLRDVVAGVLY